MIITYSAEKERDESKCELDLYGTAVYCKECSEKVMVRRGKGNTDGQSG